MSIATEITRLQNAKAAIKTAIEGKGVTVPDATLMDGMAALIDAIEAGGGEALFSTGTVTQADNTSTVYTIEHGLGKRPSTIILTQEPTGTADKIVNVRFVAISKYGVGSYVLSGNGTVGSNYKSVSCTAETAEKATAKWDGTTVYSTDIVGQVTETNFRTPILGARTYRWVVF